MDLGKRALDMLDYNGYSLKHNQHEILFKHSSTDQIGLIIMLILCVLVSLFLVSVQLIVGIVSLMVTGLIFTPLLRRSVGKLRMLINKEQKLVQISHSDSVSSRYSFETVQGIFTRSKFVDEYSSAFKSTSKEYQVTIGLELENDNLIPIFKLISDHSTPSKEMDEVAEFLKCTINQSASLR